MFEIFNLTSYLRKKGRTNQMKDDPSSPNQIDRSSWIPKIRDRLNSEQQKSVSPVISYPRCFSCGGMLLEVIFGRGSGFGPRPGGYYGVGCVITHETPEYVCAQCGRGEGLLWKRKA